MTDDCFRDKTQQILRITVSLATICVTIQVPKPNKMLLKLQTNPTRDSYQVVSSYAPEVLVSLNCYLSLQALRDFNQTPIIQSTRSLAVRCTCLVNQGPHYTHRYIIFKLVSFACVFNLTQYSKVAFYLTLFLYIPTIWFTSSLRVPSS